MQGKSILCVEDSRKVQNFNTRMLKSEGFKVEQAMTLATAKAFLERQTTDAILLDIGMPDGNGLDFLKEFRKTSNTPVLLLTGFGDNTDVVKGFQSGCDDYLPKPYSFDVLLVRLNWLLANMERVPETVTRGPLTLNILAREAFLNGESLMLAPKDFTLLHFFIQNEGNPLKAEDIYEKVWMQTMNGDSQAISQAASRLRKKIEGSGYVINSVYGCGYRFE